ncbi:hypothetical protein [Paenisporosarcina sp. OV554]|uniref:hypothetical protein n=1 Tax=Paenisporosarcina sp. OV554 TaxID=2135694 RepID=UPI0013048815|nr:hypothetical protein [Paenisporosarcina sp. OV554]
MREILWQHLHDPLPVGPRMRPTSMWFSFLLAQAERAASANLRSYENQHHNLTEPLINKQN